MVIEVKTADGVDVSLGVTYYDMGGNEFTPTRMDVNHLRDGEAVMLWSRLAEKWVSPSDLYAREPEPDSWERLEEDAGKSACEYFGGDGCHAGDSCHACRAFGSESCVEEKAHDVIARAKKLAGVAE